MNPEQEKARQSAEAEMKIYTPHQVLQEKRDNIAFDNALVRIYERPYHPVGITPEPGVQLRTAPVHHDFFLAHAAQSPYSTVFVWSMTKPWCSSKCSPSWFR